MANDSLNFSATSNTTTVTAKPSLQIDLAGHNYMNYATVGQPVYFTAATADGTPPYRYQWYYRPYYVGTAFGDFYPLGDTMPGAASQNFTFTGNSTGHYLVTVRVWDSQNIEGYFMSLPPGIWINVGEPTTPSPSPTISILSPLTNSFFNVSLGGVNYQLIYETNSSLSWVDYSVDGASNVTVTGNSTFVHEFVSSNKYQTLTVYANDTSGNWAIPQTVTYLVNFYPDYTPTPSPSIPEFPSTFSYSLNLSFSTIDNLQEKRV